MVQTLGPLSNLEVLTWNGHIDNNRCNYCYPRDPETGYHNPYMHTRVHPYTVKFLRGTEEQRGRVLKIGRQNMEADSV